MATRFAFVDDSGETRLAGYIVPEPGGGGLPFTGWTEDDSDPGNVSTNGGTIDTGQGDGITTLAVGGSDETRSYTLQSESLVLEDSDTGAGTSVSLETGVTSAPTGDTAFIARNDAGATVAFDGSGMPVKNLAEGTDPSDAATVSQLGGSVPGVSIVRAFPFAFDTADLETFAALYTPTIGDLLLDGWISVLTAWDGTTPFADYGQGPLNGSNGVCINGFNVQDMTVADQHALAAGLLSGGTFHPNTGAQFASLSAVEETALELVANVSGGGGGGVFRILPAVIETADPIGVIVSTTGTSGGSDPGATQGAAILYLVTCTPAT